MEIYTLFKGTWMHTNTLNGNRLACDVAQCSDGGGGGVVASGARGNSHFSHMPQQQHTQYLYNQACYCRQIDCHKYAVQSTHMMCRTFVMLHSNFYSNSPKSAVKSRMGKELISIHLAVPRNIQRHRRCEISNTVFSFRSMCVCAHVRQCWFVLIAYLFAHSRSRWHLFLPILPFRSLAQCVCAFGEMYRAHIATVCVCFLCTWRQNGLKIVCILFHTWT